MKRLIMLLVSLLFLSGGCRLHMVEDAEKVHRELDISKDAETNAAAEKSNAYLNWLYEPRKVVDYGTA